MPLVQWDPLQLRNTTNLVTFTNFLLPWPIDYNYLHQMFSIIRRVLRGFVPLQSLMGVLLVAPSLRINLLSFSSIVWIMLEHCPIFWLNVNNTCSSTHEIFSWCSHLDMTNSRSHIKFWLLWTLKTVTHLVEITQCVVWSIEKNCEQWLTLFCWTTNVSMMLFFLA